MKQAFAGLGITWTVQSAEAGYLVADVQVPKAVIKQVIGLGVEEVRTETRVEVGAGQP
jgi:hypothetical protein